MLPTGVRITPEAASGALFQALNPDLPTNPDFVAGQAVATSTSPDGNTLLILTSGYNRNNGPTGSRVTAESNEYVFVYDISAGTPVKRQVIQVPNTFNGIVWNPNGREFYVSGGVNDNVHVYGLQADSWTEQAAIALGHGNIGLGIGVRPIAAGMAVTQDGKRLLVANMQNDSVSVIDLETRAEIAELDLRAGKNDPAQVGVPGGSYPYWVAIMGNGKAYVSSQRDREVVVLDIAGSQPAVIGRIPVGGQPNKMILNRDQHRLFVANGNSDSVSVIDTVSDTVLEEFNVTAPKSVLTKADKLRGANPNSLALSPSERFLLVTNGGTNSIAVVKLGLMEHEAKHGGSDDRDEGHEDGRKSRVMGLIPTGWYPNSVSLSKNGDTLYVVNGKSNAGPNPGACRNTPSIAAGSLSGCNANNQYVWQLTKAGFLSMPMPSERELAQLTWQVAKNNGFTKTDKHDQAQETMAFLRNKIKHVIYVVKENRTYDQILGDLEKGNGDPSLTIFPEPITPNHHNLARKYVTLDNFHDSGEVSGDGWNWTTAARTTDYTEKTVAVNYGGRGFTYDWEGANRNINVSLPTTAERVAQNSASPNDPDLLPGTADVAAPDAAEEAGAGYLWDGALRAGLSIRNYGFFVGNLASSNSMTEEQLANPYAYGLPQAAPLKQALAPHTDPYFRGYDQNNADFYLFKEWEREFDQYAAKGTLPNLSFVRLPHDHFGNYSTAKFGVNTVETQMADNDYAIGLLVQKVANSPFKDDTLIFIVEDDAQNAPDHMDAHRSIAYVVGPHVKQGALVSEHYTTVSMLRTIEDILGIKPMGITDGLALPMAELFEKKKRPWGYTALVPEVLRTTGLPLPERTAVNSLPLTGKAMAYAKPKRNAEYWAEVMGGQDFSVEDNLNEPRFNRALWQGLKDAPYPSERHGRDLSEERAKLLLDKVSLQ
ncbi:MAG TPA: bifunctional YncE family protein/alkaline phosphatase family protein [Thiobacillus sp.]|nr:bifunctional YncE family protein/alkaline phosphatase family protein [Thiobacillus sp.]